MLRVDLVHDLSFFIKLPHFLQEMVLNKYLKSGNQLLLRAHIISKFFLSAVHFDVKHQYIWVYGSRSFMQRPVHLLFGRVKTNMDGQKYGWTGKNEEAKKLHRCCQLCLESECKWCQMCVCVFVAHFRSPGTICKFVNQLNS